MKTQQRQIEELKRSQSITSSSISGATGTPIVVFAWGQSNTTAIPAANNGDKTTDPLVYFWNTDMHTSTTVVGTTWNVGTFGVAPLNVGSAPYANNFTLHFAKSLRQRFNRPVYVIIIARGETRIEAWIKSSTLAANGWSRGSEPDLSALMYPGIATALAAIPGSPTKIDYVVGTHGGANFGSGDTDTQETYAAMLTAIMTDLGSLINLNTTPIIHAELANNNATERRRQHYNALLRVQENLPTFRIVRTSGLPVVSGNAKHFTGEGLVMLGKYMASIIDRPVDRPDYASEEVQFGPDIGFRYFTEYANGANFDIADRPAYYPSNVMTLVKDSNLGWCYTTPSNSLRAFWSRRVLPTPQKGLINIVFEAITYDVGATIDMRIAVHQFDKDGVSLGEIVYTPPSGPLTDAAGRMVYSATFARSGITADVTLNSSCEFFSYGLKLGLGADDEQFRFNVNEMRIVRA
jgi:Carbohydrate esterase, sialic acid-specific acetylesterase